MRSSPLWLGRRPWLGSLAARLVGLTEGGGRPGEAFEERRQVGQAPGPGVLHGSVGEIVDRVGAYGEAGADWVILAMRAPFDVDGLDLFASEVLPQLS